MSKGHKDGNGNPESEPGWKFKTVGSRVCQNQATLPELDTCFQILGKKEVGAELILKSQHCYLSVLQLTRFYHHRMFYNFVSPRNRLKIKVLDLFSTFLTTTQNSFEKQDEIPESRLDSVALCKLTHSKMLTMHLGAKSHMRSMTIPHLSDLVYKIHWCHFWNNSRLIFTAVA